MTWRRLLILNLALLAACVAAILHIRRSWYEFEATHRVESVQPAKEPNRGLPAGASIAVAAEDWTDIAVKNPFSFDRNDIALVTPKQTAPAQPKPVLLGTISIGNEWIAMLAAGQSGSRASRPVKVGGSLENWEVVEVRDKTAVVVSAAGVRETLIMNDPKDQLARSSERTSAGATRATNVVTTGQPPQTPSTAANPTAPPLPAQPATTGQPTGDFLDTPFGRVPRTKP